MTEQQAMRMALEALEANDKLINGEDDCFGLEGAMDGYYSGCFDIEGVNKKTNEAITALRQALEQQHDEPVAWMWYVNNGAGYVSRGIGFHQTDIPFAKHTPLYTRPQPAAWVGLTDVEIKRIGKLDWDSNYVGLWYDFAKAIEAKLKEKNT